MITTNGLACGKNRTASMRFSTMLWLFGMGTQGHVNLLGENNDADGGQQAVNH